MTVHHDPRRKTWFYVIDLPRGEDGKRRQKWCRGFKTEKLAQRAEDLARKQFGQADLAADGTVAAELTQWLEERELDVALTTLSNYRNAIMKYIIPHLGARQLYDLDKRAINDLYRLRLYAAWVLVVVCGMRRGVWRSRPRRTRTRVGGRAPQAVAMAAWWPGLSATCGEAAAG